MKARDVMSTQVVTVALDTPVRDVAALMLTQGVSGVPVVDRDGRLRGLVSEGDLMRRAETGTDTQHRSWWLRLFGSEEREAREYIKTHGLTARDVMTRELITVKPEEEIAQVALLLERQRIKRVPVVEDGALIGVVSRADLLRAFATHTELPSKKIASDREIREALIAHLEDQDWAESAMVNVIVNDGVINLWGVYDSEEQHEALLLAARATAGARAVEDHMSQSLPT